MKKQEAIQKAYDGYKCSVDEDGWTNFKAIEFFGYKNLDSKINRYKKIIYRPKSLQGIEDNNGWIKIESEADLPKDETMYWASNDNYIYNYCYSKLEFLEDYKKDNTLFTHYKPIIKPEPPIY